MADRTETLAFVIDIHVRNAKALGLLNAELAALANARARHLIALQEAATGAADSHRDLAQSIADVQAATRAGGGGSGPVIVPSAQRSSTDAALWGVRGPIRPGSRNNPMATAQESGEAAGLGSLAAGSSGDRTQVRPAVPVPLPTSQDKSWLTAAAEQVAAKVTQPEDARMIAAVTAASRLRPSSSAAPASDPASMLAAAEAVRQASAGPDRSMMLQTVGNILATRVASGQASPVLLSAAAAAARLGVPRSRVYDLAGAGALAGAQKSGGQWQIPEAAVLGMLAGGGAGGGGGGGAAAAAGGAAGGGFLGKLLWGTGGLMGLAAFGSLGSLAGLGPEHVLMTALGIAGSGAAALGGAGALALGAAGQTAVGGGADALVAKTTLSNVNSVTTAMNNLEQAVATYGAGSAQAAQAQNQLNFAISQLPPAAAKQEVALATAQNNLHDYWQTASAPAQVQFTKIAGQGIGAANTFVPLVAQAANTNLGIINRDLKPFFAWLQGPQGMGIFHDLENQFAHNLPTAIHAGSQAFEVILRVVDLASRYTGGFTQKLDALFTRLNGESNVQLDSVIRRLIGDFEVWKNFVDALIRDIARLFSNDVGTGTSIIQTLTVMLDKLGQWESSVQGRQGLMTIFTVHKAEIQQLLQILPLLVNAFGPLYMRIAPALTSAFTLVAGAIISVIKAVESIPGGTWLVGIALMTSKIGTLAGLLDKAAIALGIIKAAEATAGGGLVARAALGGGAAAGAESAVAAGAGGSLLSRFLGGGLAGKLAGTGLGAAAGGVVEAGALGIGGAAEGAGMAGLADAILGAGAAVAPIAAALTPLLVGVGGVVGLVELFNLFSSGQNPTTKYSSSQLTQILQQHGTKALSMPATSPSGPTFVTAGRGGVQAVPSGPTIGDIASTKAMRDALQQYVTTASNAGDVSKMSASQLAGMVHEGEALAKIFPQDAQVIDKFKTRLQQDLAPLQNVMHTMTQRWNQDATGGLKTLTDVFDSNTRLIAHIVGLNSVQGEQVMRTNISRMVADLTNGMASGRISVRSGMAEIDRMLKEGVSQGAITWKTQWTDMFSTLGTLYADGKLSSGAYLADLQALWHTASVKIKQDTNSQYQQMFAYYKAQRDAGHQLDATMNAKDHAARVAANAQAKIDMQAFAANIASGMIAAAGATDKGVGVMISELNKALTSLGAKTLGAAISVSVGSIGSQITAGLGGFALGGMVNRPTYVVGEEGPAHPEWVIASNPAYRHRNVGLWADAGHALGIPGFAKGGTIGTPHVSGAGALAAIVSAGLEDVDRAANAYLGKHSPTAGGAISGSTKGLSGSLLNIVRQLSGRFGWAGQVGDWLEVINRESGGSMTARNASSGAYGIAQFINGPGEYAQYGGNVGTMAGQLLAMANYIRQRYGNPANAWAHELSAGWYAKGGKVNWAGRFGAGGMVTASSPTLAMFGDNGAETAMFLPHYKTGGKASGALYGSIDGPTVVVPVGGVADIKALTKAIEKLISGITNETALQGTQSSIATTLQSLKPGTSLKTLGLSGVALKASGLSAGMAQALIGGGPASDAARAALDASQAATDKSEQAKLTALYNKAVKAHNSKLAKSLLDQLTAVDAAMTTAIADEQAALVQQITDTAGLYANLTSAIGDSATTLSAIQNLTSGTDLSSLGLSPDILATLGLSGTGNQTGTALSIAQGLQSSQGGYLTPAQLAAAQSGVSAQNSTLTAEEAPIEGELAYYQSQLPNLTGTDRTSAVSAMQALAQQLLGLAGTIQSNNTSLAALTAATTANTTATTANTGSMTGSTAFVYNGGNYLASDNALSLNVGG